MHNNDAQALPTDQPQHSHRHSSALSLLLDLDACVHEQLLDAAMDAAAAHVDGTGVHRVLDVGAGTGTGTFRWAHRYPKAEVIALDANPAMAATIEARVAGEHVRTLTRPVQELGIDADSIDLAWASSVFHEFDDPAVAFDVLSHVIRPGGLLAIMEMDAPPRLLPVEYDELESRLRALADADAPGPEWTARLGDSGFELLDKRTLVSDRELAWDGPGGDYARAELHRLAFHGSRGLNAEQQASLSRILNSGNGAPDRSGVHIRGTRSLWIARRP
ncbi:MAG: class I SAM-dependent methyltransferase [Gordonia amarae]